MKISFLGRSGTGKSSTIARICGWAPRKIETMGICIDQVRLAQLENITLSIWDVGGTGFSVFKHISSEMTSGVDIAVVCFSFSDRLSFENVQSLVTAVKASSPRAEIIIVGTHCDLWMTSEVTRDDTRDLSTQLGCPVRFVCNEPSAEIEDDGISGLISTIVDICKEKQQTPKRENNSNDNNNSERGSRQGTVSFASSS